jgi:O-acetyl-ADP-ribose deacetylase (regulator of RNase III)
MLTEITGNLFSDTTSSLAHCVAADLWMGRGIAVEFKRRFGGQVELQGTRVGDVGVMTNHARFIYYLVTKQHSTGKPTMETIRASLVAMKHHAIAHHVSQISMPRIGCGLDRLDWALVKPLIIDVFDDTSIQINAYVL